MLDEEGVPVEGAVVCASTGARAVTDGRGEYLIETEVPRGATNVEVSAIGGGQPALVARKGVFVDQGGGRIAMDPLCLSSESACSPRWIPTFGPAPGLDGPVQALLPFDDGTGPSLFVGGDFTQAGSSRALGIAKWDGHSWSSIGEGTSRDVRALAEFDDGTGPALYVAGRFTSVGGMPVGRIAKWNGVDWEPLGSGLSWYVYALAVFDDGSGPALYAAGRFGQAGGVPATRIAKWDGASWSALGSGIEGEDAEVLALTVFDDGNGEALYATGSFTTAGGVPVKDIAKWDGASWSALGTGIEGTDNGSPPKGVCLATFDDGSGPALYVGGNFTTAGGIEVDNIARWDGGSWSAVGEGLNRRCRALCTYDDGSGPALYAGGTITFGSVSCRVAKWDGASWSPLDDWGDEGSGNPALGLAVFDDGAGSTLYAGGGFSGRPSESGQLNRIGKWDGQEWVGLGGELGGHTEVLQSYDDGSGPSLFVSGGASFVSAGGVVLNRIGKWNGTEWFPLADGVETNGSVEDMVAVDGVGGSELYANWRDELHAWNGSSWSYITETSAPIYSLEVFDDGLGPVLYVGGGFEYGGGVELNNIGRWDGADWSGLGSGVDDSVLCLAVHDDGSGPSLFVGGGFEMAGGLSAKGVAEWDGASWSALPGLLLGPNGSVSSLATFDDGTGPALYAGGFFAFLGTDPGDRISVAKWDGSEWSAVGGGVDGGGVQALTVFDDGTGDALYAAGNFDTAGGVAANGIAKWDGTTWSPLGGGVDGGGRTFPQIFDLETYEVDGAPCLFAAGHFFECVDSGDSFLARWGVEASVLDFETEDDFTTPLRNGQDLTSPPEFGRVVSISSFGPNAGAAIFDSSPGGPNDPSQDPDLLVDSGNLVILQTDNSTGQLNPGYFDFPDDDEDGGTITFDFSEPVMLMSIALVDIDGAAAEPSLVLLRDEAGRVRVYFVPAGWTGDRVLDGTSGRRTLSLQTLSPQPGHLSAATASETVDFDARRVVSLDVRLGSSGAVDDVRYCGGAKQGAGPLMRAAASTRTGAR